MAGTANELIDVACIDPAVPFIVTQARYLYIQKRNAEIAERNQLRRGYARLLASPSGELKEKLLAAQSGARLENVSDSVVYSSDKSVQELVRGGLS